MQGELDFTKEADPTISRQCQRVLDYMRSKGGITSWEAWTECGCSRLASRVHDLHKGGFQIEKETVKGENRWGESVRYARYKEV